MITPLRSAAKLLTRDEARRIAANSAKRRRCWDGPDVSQLPPLW